MKMTDWPCKQLVVYGTILYKLTDAITLKMSTVPELSVTSHSFKCKRHHGKTENYIYEIHLLQRSLSIVFLISLSRILYKYRSFKCDNN